jgi:hypothetical protein
VISGVLPGLCFCEGVDFCLAGAREAREVQCFPGGKCILVAGEREFAVAGCSGMVFILV